MKNVNYNSWRVQYTSNGEAFEVILMRKSYAASIIRALRSKKAEDIVVIGPKEEMDAEAVESSGF